MTRPKKTIAYTIGHAESYRVALKKRAIHGKPLFKVGRTSEYEGGCVFRNISIAIYGLKTHFKDGYSIFLLQLPKPWDVCVDASTEAKLGYGLLLEDAIILEEHKFLLKKFMV